jgi:iron complex outermembrane receptor protein
LHYLAVVIFQKEQNDHRGGNDGNNAQVDMNYGTSLGKEKSFINATASFQLRGQTGGAKMQGTSLMPTMQ